MEAGGSAESKAEVGGQGIKAERGSCGWRLLERLEGKSEIRSWLRRKGGEMS